MSSSVTALASQDGDNSNLEGYCSRCHRIWTLKTAQGVCQWCAHLAVCQSSPTKPRSIKSRSTTQKRQAPVIGQGYDRLPGQWLAFYNVASRFIDRVKPEDREDILHTIIMTLADVDRNNGDKPFTEAIMYRIASRTVSDYWFTHYRSIAGLDCKHCSTAQRQKCKANNLYIQCPKAIKLESLNTPIIDSDGNTTELGELIADDTSLDLDAWVDARTFILGFPKRLLQIAFKINNGQSLEGADRKYLCKWRQREQKVLIAG